MVTVTAVAEEGKTVSISGQMDSEFSTVQDDQLQFLSSPTGIDSDNDIYWSDQFACPDLAYSVFAMATYDGDLIFGGFLSNVAGIQVNSIARWNGSNWSTLGEGFTYYTQSIGRVYTLLEWDGLLVAGGFFSHSGNTVVNNIAVWNGSIWSSLGSGLSNNVKALAVFNEVLYAGGEFGLSRWTGTSWESVMTQSWAYSVEALAVFNNLLYVGGKFTETPDGPADHIAVFDGNQWDVVGSGTDDDVYALSVYDDKLRVGGTFTNAGGIVANHVAYWDGFSWGTMGDGTIGTVYEFHDFNETLIAGCKNYEYLDDPSASLAKWSGTEWEIIEDGVEGIAQAMITYENELVAVGDFEYAGEIYSIGSWDGIEWEPLPTSDFKGIDNYVNALTVYNGNLVAGGTFKQAGRKRCKDVAMWDGFDWSPLGEGFDREVNCLGVYDGLLIAGARHHFGYEGEQQIGAWDGLSWQFIDEGLEACNVPAIYDFIEYDGKLVVAGGYFELFGEFIGHLAVWDGVGWSGMDIPSPSFSRLMALGVYEGNLIVGGITKGDSTELNHIYSWDGSVWTALGDGVNGYVYTICAYRDELYIGGMFDHIGDVAVNEIARWNGDSWTSVGGGFDENVHSLCEYNGSLIATGDFKYAGGIPMVGIASWSGSQWSPLGSCLNGSGFDVVVHDNSLVVGGLFTTAGQDISSHIAFWNKPSSCCLGYTGNVDGDINDAVNVSDLTYLVAYLFTSGPPHSCEAEANIDGNGGIDVSDMTCLVAYLFTSGSALPLCP